MPSLIEEVRAAYKVAGLIPFEKFARDIKESRRNNPRYQPLDHDPESQWYRGIGATTWMCVYGVVRFVREENVHLVTQGVPPDVDLLGTLLQRLSGGKVYKHDIRNGRNGAFRLVASAFGDRDRNLAWTSTSDPASIKARVGIPALHILRDPAFKARLVRRLLGPFKMAWGIREENGRFRVYAEDDEFLFETTTEGVRILMESGVPKIKSNAPIGAPL